MVSPASSAAPDASQILSDPHARHHRPQPPRSRIPGGIRPGRLDRHGWLLLAVVAAGLCGNYILYLLGLDLVTPSAAQVVIQLAPLFLALGGLVFFGERFSPAQWAGFLLVISGLALFFHHRLGEILALQHFGLGVLTVTGAAVSWGAYALAQKQLLGRWASDAIMWSVYLAAIVVFLPMAQPGALLSLSPAALLLLLYACLNTLVAYGCFAEALAHWEASRVSAVLAITPLLTILMIRLLSVLAPGTVTTEPVDALSIAGAFTVVTGSMMTALLQPAGSRRAPTPGATRRVAERW